MANEIVDDTSAAVLDIDNSDAYDSAEDEDFQLDEAGDEVGDDSGLSSSEDDDDDEGEEEEGAGGDGRPTKKRKLDKSISKKRKKGPHEEEGRMEWDSGDEVTLQKAKKSKTKKRKSADEEEEEEEDDILFDEDDEGGEGGFVKTRSMRMKIQEDRKPLAKIDGATIDVDALWAKMNAPDTDSGLLPAATTTTTEAETQVSSADQNKENVTETQEKKLPSEDFIKIKRTYKFAGQIHTEEKLVPRDSAEAKLYLAETSGGEKGGTSSTPETESQSSDSPTVAVVNKLRRPLRKVSRFDPNPSGVIKKNWEKQPRTTALTAGKDGDDDDAAAAAAAKGPKLNTVEKSRLDWAKYVDETGIKDELNVHSKAKEGYLGRMDFLDRVDAKREEERRNLRLKGM